MYIHELTTLYNNTPSGTYLLYKRIVKLSAQYLCTHLTSGHTQLTSGHLLHFELTLCLRVTAQHTVLQRELNLALAWCLYNWQVPIVSDCHCLTSRVPTASDCRLACLSLVSAHVTATAIDCHRPASRPSARPPWFTAVASLVPPVPTASEYLPCLASLPIEV